MPIVLGDTVHWPAEGDNQALVWHGAIRRPSRLWQNAKQIMMWEPVVLNGEVSMGDGCLKRGYVERLSINFAPWLLGLKVLRWGRFCGQKHSLVWIEWLGAISKKMALLNGIAESLFVAGGNEVCTQNAQLTLDNATEIVSEPLGSGALAALEWGRFFAAQRFLTGIETKWFAASVLALHGEVVDTGFSIYEEVVWP